MFMEYVHWAEDADIVPAQTIYLMGCNLECLFCQTGDERRRLPAATLTPGLFRSILDRGRAAGARTVDILGGEPTVNAPALVELFAAGPDFPGLVWNTNLYGCAETFGLLDGIVDIFLADIKFGNAACSARLSGTADAGDVARARSREIMARGPEKLIVRHLVVPGHFDCCTRPVLEWIAAELPGVRVSLKTVFMPWAGRKEPENRFLTPGEVDAATALAASLGLRLTRDAVLPGPDDGAVGDGRPIDFEVAISPAGDIYLRHVVREAAALLAAIQIANEGGQN